MKMLEKIHILIIEEMTDMIYFQGVNAGTTIAAPCQVERHPQERENSRDNKNYQKSTVKIKWWSA